MSGSPKLIKVEKAKVVNRNISHRFVVCDREEKDDWNAYFLLAQKTDRRLIFCRTRAGTIKLGSELEQVLGLTFQSLDWDSVGEHCTEESILSFDQFPWHWHLAHTQQPSQTWARGPCYVIVSTQQERISKMRD